MLSCAIYADTIATTKRKSRMDQNRVYPNRYYETEFAAAKDIIDWVVGNESVYVNGSSKNRTAAKCCLAPCLMPCVVYSVVARLVSCPFQCVFNSRVGCNPLAACLTDSAITMRSDRCISGTCGRIDAKKEVKMSMDARVNQDIVIYAADVILKLSDNEVKEKYAVADAVAGLVYFLTLKRDATPEDVVKLAATYRNK